MLSHVEMDDAPPLTGEDQKDEQQLEINGRYDLQKRKEVSDKDSTRQQHGMPTFVIKAD
jgi:hypothetical protein